MPTVETRNEIRTERLIRAPKDKVWWALTTREGWIGWFSNDVHGNFEKGETLTLDFGPYGLCYAIVDEVRPKDRFAYRWHPGEDCAIEKYGEDQMTTVRFDLADHVEGTLLTMTESGFDHLPEERRQSAFMANTEGWSYELNELADWVENDQRQVIHENQIVRERTYPCSREVLWDLLGTEEGMKKWSVKEIEGKMAEGEVVVFHYESSAMTLPMKIVTLDRPERIVFRWHPAMSSYRWGDYDEAQTTEVTITLTEITGGTKMRVVESGFENVPEGRRGSAMLDNFKGWSGLMDEIGGAVEKYGNSA